MRIFLEIQAEIDKNNMNFKKRRQEITPQMSDSNILAFEGVRVHCDILKRSDLRYADVI